MMVHLASEEIEENRKPLLSPASESLAGNHPSSDLDGCMEITKDGGVLKRVLREGHSEGPAPAFARCLGKHRNHKRTVFVTGS